MLAAIHKLLRAPLLFLERECASCYSQAIEGSFIIPGEGESASCQASLYNLLRAPLLFLVRESASLTSCYSQAIEGLFTIPRERVSAS